MGCNTDDCSVFLDREGSDDAIAGLRFTGLFVPQGIKIENAYIQFTAKEVDTGYCKLYIRGHDVDNSPSAEDALYDYDSATAAEVIWEPDGWRTIGAAGPDQRTPDLSSIIQEIVSRPGYTINSAITIIITGEGAGQRTAVSYECTQDSYEDCDTFNTDAAAALTVFYSTFPTISSIMAPESGGADIHLFPNPVMNLLSVETVHSGFHSIEITTLNGQLLYSKIIEGPTHQIDLSSFEKGLYFITVRSRDYVRREKIIKL